MLHLLGSCKAFSLCKWFEYLVKNRIPFYIRIKEDILTGGVRNGHVIPFKDILRGLKEGNTKILDRPIKLLGQMLHVAASRLKDELLIVVTNKNHKKALKYYKLRW